MNSAVLLITARRHERIFPLFIESQRKRIAADEDQAPIAANVPGADPSIMRQMLERQGETVMKHCVGTMARCGAQGSPELDDLARPGDDVADRIVVAATRLNVDLIVMGTRGRPGVGHARVGSIAERVLRRAACPVLTIPSHWSVADREALPRANDAAKPRAQAVFARTSQTVSH